jgi:hypothetical protein
MCAVMCLGGAALGFAAFEAASALGYPSLAVQKPELSAAIITVCLAVPMAGYMAARGHGRRHNLVMTGSTILVGLAVIGMLWSGAIATDGLQNWRGLFGLICPPRLPGHGRGNVNQLQHVQRASTPSRHGGLTCASIHHPKSRPRYNST